jgi:hypothetical protein
MKKCYRCGVEKEVTEFYKHPVNLGGYSNRCKECTKIDVKQNRKDKKEHYNNYDRNRPNEVDRRKRTIEQRNQKYSSDPEFRKKRSDYSKEDRKNNPQKYKARDAMTVARRNGTLIRPEACEHCGTSEKKIQGHHWSYLPEHWLDVIWLCTSCHGKEHKRLNELGRDPDKLKEMENIS